MRKLKGESGQVLVLTALSMMLLMGFMGFAIDVGQLFHAKRTLQAAADDAAVAGALAYQTDTKGGGTASATHIQNSAQTAAEANGVSSSVTVTTSYSSSVTTPTLAIMSPPADGPNMNTNGFVEAILTVPQSTTFMSLFGFSSVNVMTRAVAGPGATSPACIYILDPDGESMYMGGKFTVNAPGCGIVINSNNSCALYFNGGGQGQSSTLTSGWVSVNGGACKQVSDSTPPPVINTGVQVADPLKGIVNWPTLTDCDSTNSATTITTSYTPTADSVVCFPFTVTIGTSGNYNGSCTSSNTINLGDALYVFEKGVIFNGGCVNTTGATFDLYGSYKASNGTYYSITTTTGTEFNLNAPSTSFACNSCVSGSSGTYGNADIVIEQPYGNTGILNLNQGTSVGNAGAFGTLTGEIYAPAAELSLTDQGAASSTGTDLTLNADLIVGSLSDQASNVTINSLQDTTNTQLKHVTLVE